MNRGQIIPPKDGRAWACRWYDGAGSRRSKGGFRTKGEATKFLNERLAEGRLGALYEPNLTYADLVERFLAAYTAAPATVERMIHMLAKSNAMFGAYHLRDIRPDQIEIWRATLTPGTRWDATRSMRQILEWATRMRLTTDNPAKLVKNTKPKTKEVVPFEAWEEIDAIAAELDPRYAAIPSFVVGTGLRPSEWLALEARDIDLSARTVTVNRAFAEKTREITTPKTGVRTVPLRLRALDAVAHVRKIGRRDLVFCSPAGVHLDLHNWRNREWNPALEAAGIEHRRIYDLRHTYATWSLRAGVNTFQLARRMGTSLEMIEKTYGHLASDSASHELAMLEAFDSHER